MPQQQKTLGDTFRMQHGLMEQTWSRVSTTQEINFWRMVVTYTRTEMVKKDACLTLPILFLRPL